MAKSRLTFMLLGLLAAGTAFAMPPAKPMGPSPNGCPVAMRHRFFHHPMIPMLLPLAEMRSYTLHLSDNQVSALAVWHNRHMRLAVPLMKQLRDDKRALHESLLQRAGRGTVQGIMNRLDRDRARLLGLEVAQVRIVRKTLSVEQWRKLLAIYHRMPPMRFMMMHP